VSGGKHVLPSLSHLGTFASPDFVPEELEVGAVRGVAVLLGPASTGGGGGGRSIDWERTKESRGAGTETSGCNCQAKPSEYENVVRTVQRVVFKSQKQYTGRC